MAACQRALEAFNDELARRDREDEPSIEPRWTTANHVVTQCANMRLRDFSQGQTLGAARLIVAPFALHDAALADLAPGHSLVETLQANGCERLLLVEWTSATPEMRFNTIDAQLAALNVAVDDSGAPVDLIGLCQGGWLSLIFAARFPEKVRKLVVAGSPIDAQAARAPWLRPRELHCEPMIEQLIRLGNGLVLGRHTAELWPHDPSAANRLNAALQLDGPPKTDEQRAAAEAYALWERRLLDLPGVYYRQVFELLYRDNRLAAGTFPALGRIADLSRVASPLYLLAGAQDQVSPPAQVFAAAELLGASRTDVTAALADCAHCALFMGARTLAEEWPRIARWLAA